MRDNITMNSVDPYSLLLGQCRSVLHSAGLSEMRRGTGIKPAGSKGTGIKPAGSKENTWRPYLGREFMCREGSLEGYKN